MRKEMRKSTERKRRGEEAKQILGKTTLILLQNRL
jgi:hypothetical protein